MTFTSHFSTRANSCGTTSRALAFYDYLLADSWHRSPLQIIIRHGTEIDNYKKASVN